MGILTNRVTDELAKLDAEEAALDESYAAKKRTIKQRRFFLNQVLPRLTPELEDLVERLGVNFTT